MEVSGYSQLCAYIIYQKFIFFCVHRKEEIHTDLERHEEITEFSFLGELSL